MHTSNYIMHINVYIIYSRLNLLHIINFRDLLAPNGEFLNEGDRLCQIQLAGTLEAIAEHGIGYFYDSSFTEEMVEELQQDYGSILTVEDFQKYSSVERPVVTAKFKNHTMLSIPPPACGATLGLILNMLDGKIIISKKHCFRSLYIAIVSIHRESQKEPNVCTATKTAGFGNIIKTMSGNRLTNYSVIKLADSLN